MAPKSLPAARTPAKTPSLKRQPSSSAGTQKTIVQFFSKSANSASKSTPKPTASAPDSSPCLRESTRTNTLPKAKRPLSMTPVASSDAIEPSSSQENMDSTGIKVALDALPSPSTPAETMARQISDSRQVLPSSSPTRKVVLPFCFHHDLDEQNPDFSSMQVRKPVNYAEQSDDEDDDPFDRIRAAGTRRRTKIPAAPADDGDDYEDAASNDGADEDEGRDALSTCSLRTLLTK